MKKHNIFHRTIGAAVIMTSMLCSVAWAAQDPVAMLEEATQEMIDALKREEATLQEDRTRTYVIVEEIVFPHVDFQTTAKMALGRKNWDEATSAQREEFTNEFTTLLVRTYATALADYENETIEYVPLREPVGNKSRVQVDASVIVPGQDSFDLTYRLVLRGDNWKIYDITIQGVSFVQSFRAQFDSEIGRVGLDNVINDLAARNAELMAQAKAESGS